MIEVTLLKTPGCEACKRSRQTIEAVQEEYDFSFAVIDLTEQPELAQEYPVMSAPGIVIDGELVFQGGVSKQELREALDERTEA